MKRRSFLKSGVLAFGAPALLGRDELLAFPGGMLEQESNLLEIVRLVGAEALSPAERLALETSKSIREDFLHQNAFDEIDTHTSLKKKYWMLKAILTFHQKGLIVLDKGAKVDQLAKLAIKEKIVKAKFVPENKTKELEDSVGEIVREIEKIGK